MQLFFTEEIDKGHAILTEEEAHHCLNVLRHSIGDHINVADGKGGIYKAIIVNKSKKECELSIEDIEMISPPYYKHLSIAIAPTKNIDRFEWFIEKATEIGIHRIIPIITENSERKIIKHDRIKRVAISAMKQSNHYYLPEISELTTWADFIKASNNGILCIAHCNTIGIPHLKDLILPNTNLLICIGPEGDFTSKEIEEAHENSFLSVNLGKSRLRTETAGLYACLCFHLINL
ncbi:MAG TPA: 16S rRNA (uracil(1498)-N(3))-methyltransferase [Saprospiraceae bacterium]|nr:16S rRNA (uracil(1498)-N(3))-methyltransferase [Saprospiraceae bacterium]